MTDLFAAPPADEPKKKRAAKVKAEPAPETAAAPVEQEVLPPEPKAPKTGTALAVLENPHITAVQVFGDQKSADSIIASLRREAKAQAANLDISTKKGRDAIASLAYKIAKSKTALDNLGKEMNEAARAKINQVDAERRRLKDEIQALQEEIRKPLTDWETADKVRLEAHEEALLILENAAVFSSAEPTVEEIDARVKEIIPLMQRKWEEFETRAIAATNVAKRDLIDLRASTVQREADRVELARLREEEEQRKAERDARELADREEKIAREAAEVERKKAEEAAEIEAARTTAALAEAEAQKQRIEQERQAAIQRVEDAEKSRVEAQRVAYIRSLIQHVVGCGNGFIGPDPAGRQLLLRELQEKIVYDEATFAEFLEEAVVARDAALAKLARVEQRRIETERLFEEQAETQRLAAEREAERRANEARDLERQRVADEQAAAEADRLKREQNKAHAAKINRAVVSDLMAITYDGGTGIDDACATAIVKAIARGQISHVKIEY